MKQSIITLVGLMFFGGAFGIPPVYAQSQGRLAAEPTDTSTDRHDGDPVTIEGELSRIRGTLEIKLPDNRIFSIKSVKRPCQQDLDLLETGDYMIGQGRVQAAKQQILLDDLEMVGVHRVLGSWNDQEKRKVWEFRDYSSLDVSDHSKSLHGQVIHYRLVPDKKDEWTIFLSNNTSVKIGTMKYSPRNMKIEIIDLNTGRVTEHHSLSPHTKL